MQQTPKPLAQEPAAVPPLLVHSDLKTKKIIELSFLGTNRQIGQDMLTFWVRGGLISLDFKQLRARLVTQNRQYSRWLLNAHITLITLTKCSKFRSNWTTRHTEYWGTCDKNNNTNKWLCFKIAQWRPISCAWRHWPQMKASCIFHFLKIFFIKQTSHFSSGVNAAFRRCVYIWWNLIGLS